VLQRTPQLLTLCQARPLHQIQWAVAELSLEQVCNGQRSLHAEVSARVPVLLRDVSQGALAEGDFLSWEHLIYLADLFQSSGESRFHILGGEPTLHPTSSR